LMNVASSGSGDFSNSAARRFTSCVPNLLLAPRPLATATVAVAVAAAVGAVVLGGVAGAGAGAGAGAAGPRDRFPSTPPLSSPASVSADTPSTEDVEATAAARVLFRELRDPPGVAASSTLSASPTADAGGEALDF
jgi:hypothetical protein